MVSCILLRGLCIPEACDVRIEPVPWVEQQLIPRETLILKSLDVVDETMKHPGSEQNVG